MTQLRLTEQIVPYALTQLGAPLNSAIDAVNATVTDGYTIPHPAHVLDYVPPGDSQFDFPLVCLGDGPGRLVDDQGGYATNQCDVHVVVFLHDDDQQALTRKARRYRAAIANALMPAGRVWPGSPVWGITRLRYTPGPSTGEEPDQEGEPPKAWVTWEQVTVQVTTEEPG